MDISIDTDGYARIEKTSFDAYNESGCLKNAAKRYKERTGHYPERILADQIYRTRENRCYGLGKIVTKLEETQLASIALSVFVANLFKIQRRILFVLFYLYEIFKKETDWLSPCGI